MESRGCFGIHDRVYASYQYCDIIILLKIRDIAQFGSAPALGAGCRRFKSYYPDYIQNSYKCLGLIIYSTF